MILPFNALTFCFQSNIMLMMGSAKSKQFNTVNKTKQHTKRNEVQLITTTIKKKRCRNDQKTYRVEKCAKNRAPTKLKYVHTYY